MSGRRRTIAKKKRLAEEAAKKAKAAAPAKPKPKPKAEPKVIDNFKPKKEKTTKKKAASSKE